MNAATHTVAPLAPEEVMDFLGKLERLATSNPAAFMNEGNLGILRLALTAAYGVDGVTALDVERAAQEAARAVLSDAASEATHKVEQAEQTAAEAQRKLFALEQERGESRAKIRSLQQEVDKLTRVVKSHEGASQHATLKMEVANLQSTISLVQKALSENPGANIVDLIRKNPLATKVMQAVRERDAFQESSNELGRESDALRQQLKDAQNAPKFVRRRLVDAMEKEMARVEYSGKHPTFTFTRGGSVPCCPLCKGLDPERTSHKESGHKTGCFFKTLRGKVDKIKA